jgi:hypothetical protein
LKERGVGWKGVLKEAKQQMLSANNEKAQMKEMNIKQES